MIKLLTIILVALTLSGCDGISATALSDAIQDRFVECLSAAKSDDDKSICHAAHANYLRICFDKNGGIKLHTPTKCKVLIKKKEKQDD